MSAASPSGKVTIRDVAGAAQVSTTTVSKVLNGRPDVGPTVRQRVLDTIGRLGYRPSATARSLRVRRSQTIAIITDDLEGIFTSAMMRGVDDAASADDISVFLCNSYGDPERERAHLLRLLDKQVDGVIFMSGNRVRRRGAPVIPLDETPYVFLYEYSEDAAVASILPDDEQGAGLAVRHLLDLKRQRIGFINGPISWEATHDRLRGYERALRDAGVEPDRVLNAFADSWDPEEGYRITAALMRLSDPPDALFCASDDLATGVLAALHEGGFAIGQDVAVVGFDDRSLAVHQRPPLSTVALPLAAMGHLAGQTLLAAIRDEPHATGIQRVPCELRVRASSQPAPSRTPRQSRAARARR
jgi:LacI family transcriptional regulator, galactose operon repressor